MVVKTQSNVYSTHYHFVFVTKYRKDLDVIHPMIEIVGFLTDALYKKYSNVFLFNIFYPLYFLSISLITICV